MVKGKVLPTKAQRVYCHILGARRGLVINASLWPLYTLRERRIHGRKLGGPKEQSGLVEATINPLALDGIEPQTVQTIASRYTDYTLPL